jgi:hypothetical protein
MLPLFINITGTHILLLFVISCLLVLWAAIIALKREKGLTQILWLFRIISSPPFLAICYLLKAYVFDRRVQNGTNNNAIL